jgi:hypothetical protein
LSTPRSSIDGDDSICKRPLGLMKRRPRAYAEEEDLTTRDAEDTEE